jgi:hypothetical protein
MAFEEGVAQKICRILFAFFLLPILVVAARQQKSPMIRRLVLFFRTYRKARRLGFTMVDAMRAARVNSMSA